MCFLHTQAAYRRTTNRLFSRYRSDFCGVTFEGMHATERTKHQRILDYSGSYQLPQGLYQETLQVDQLSPPHYLQGIRKSRRGPFHLRAHPLNNMLFSLSKDI